MKLEKTIRKNFQRYIEIRIKKYIPFQKNGSEALQIPVNLLTDHFDATKIPREKQRQHFVLKRYKTLVIRVISENQPYRYR